MNLGVDFIPLVELEQMNSLNEKDKELLSNTPYFLLAIKVKEQQQQLEENHFVLIDTNQELKRNDFMIAGDKLAGLEVFQFMYEIKNQWKIKVKSLQTGKKHIKDLNDFIIYGVMAGCINPKSRQENKKDILSSFIITRSIAHYSSRGDSCQEQSCQNF